MAAVRSIVLALAMTGFAAYAQTASAPPAPGPGGPLLGRAHLWVKVGRTDLGGVAADAWGVDRERYLGIEAYGGDGESYYFGGEIGHSGVDRATNADGDTIRDFDLLSQAGRARRPGLLNPRLRGAVNDVTSGDGSRVNSPALGR